MRKRFAVLAVLLVGLVLTAAFTYNQGVSCLSFRLTDNDNESVSAVELPGLTAPWSAWIRTMGASTTATVNVDGYGPCVFSERDSATCYRSKLSVLGTLNGSTASVRGDGPVPAAGLSQTTPCSTIVCIGGANDAAACSAASTCPGGYCPATCWSIVSICGATVNP